MDLIIVSGINPMVTKPGGIRTYVLNLVNSMLAHDTNVTLIGISHNPHVEQKFTFIPISKKEKISSYGFLLSLFLKVPLLNIPRTSIIHSQRPDALLPFVLFHRKNIKVCTLHGLPHELIYLKKGKFVGTVYNFIEQYTLKHTNAIIAVSYEARDTYLQKYPWLNDKIKVIPVGIDEKLFRPMNKNKLRIKYGFNVDDKILLYVGRFEKEKRLEVLLNVFKAVKTEVNNTKLVLVGEGHEKENIDVLINKLELKDVVIMDTLPNEQVAEIMNCADVFVLTSLYEGMPTVVLEALACGVPVVSTNVGDIHKVVKNDVTGYVVAVNDSNEIENKILYILLNKNDLKDNCTLVAQDYSWNTISQRIIEVYNAFEGSI